VLCRCNARQTLADETALLQRERERENKRERAREREKERESESSINIGQSSITRYPLMERPAADIHLLNSFLFTLFLHGKVRKVSSLSLSG
jgi:hypothetical protein